MSDESMLFHDFEIDLAKLVLMNHKLTLEAIAQSETEDLESLDPQDPTHCRLSMFYADLRRAAINLAVVGLVTRLEHWIIRFSEKLQRISEPPKK